MVEVRALPLDGAFEILPTKHGDNRGFFSETYNSHHLAEKGIETNFIQDNHSFSAQKGVLRGLHYQAAPHAQDKLVRVAKGSVFDVLVDMRCGSPTYRQWFGIEVSAAKWNQVFIPKGFLHGFLTLEENTEFLYKVSAYYNAEADGSIRFDDPDIGIDWPMSTNDISLSVKDRNAPGISEVQTKLLFGEH